MIDFHSHILPGVDDGSKDIGMSKEMILNSCNQKVEFICATPHYIVGEYEISRDEYQEKMEDLRKNVDEDINIVDGLEIYINPELPKLYKEKRIWGYNNNRYLLIELPMEQFPIYTEKIFYELRLLGAIPVLAHPERNLRIMKNTEHLINLIEQGNLAQLNSGSLKGSYGSEVKRIAEKFIDMNLVHMVGSDGHNNRKRNTDIVDCYDKIKERNKHLYRWMMENEKKIVDGVEIEIPDIIENKKKKSIFDIFRK